MLLTIHYFCLIQPDLFNLAYLALIIEYIRFPSRMSSRTFILMYMSYESLSINK